MSSESVPLLIQKVEKVSSIFIQESAFLIYSTVPHLLTNLQEHSIALASVVSVAHLSTSHLAATTIANVIANLSAYTFIHGFTDTLPLFKSSSLPIALWAFRIAFILALFLPFIINLWLHIELSLLRFNVDPTVAHLTAQYLRWSAVGLPATAFNSLAKQYLSAQGKLAVLARITSIIGPFNASLNYFLVWGPKEYNLGFIGVPLSAAVTHNFLALMTFSYLCTHTSFHHFRENALVLFKDFNSLLAVGAKCVSHKLSQSWSTEILGAATSALGPESLAAQSVVRIFASTVDQGPQALSEAANIRLKSLLDKQMTRRAKIAGIVSLIFVPVVSVFSVLVLSAFRERWASMVTTDHGVAVKAIQCVPVLAVYIILVSLGSVFKTLLVSLGRTNFYTAMRLGADTSLGMPIALFLAFNRNWGLSGLWAGPCISLIYCNLCAIWVIARSPAIPVPTSLDEVQPDANEQLAPPRKGAPAESETGL